MTLCESSEHPNRIAIKARMVRMAMANVHLRTAPEAMMVSMLRFTG